MSHFYDDPNNPEVTYLIDELPFWSAPFGIKLLDIVRCKKNMKALDIGCGLGFPLLELSMRLGKTSRVYGLDPWEAGINRIQQKIRSNEISNVEVVKGRSEDMPFDDNFFDLIVSNNGINNVNDIDTTLSECHRVSKTGAQFVFTFNTDQTFMEFYDVFRQVLKDSSLHEYEGRLSEHIYSKRRPVSEFKILLSKYGFRVTSTYDDVFHYRFADAASMFDHFFIKTAFLQGWKEIIPTERHEEVFHKIETILNAKSERSDGLTMQVPFIAIDCEKS
jgi:arsenite methyltransferase